ncbi:MAG: thioether cross-link-forming SCIFF peptide maturase [Peptococcaceae bacterium]|jgi:uncharacterized protein|nr:thioether cross-link-forming SCIFF peptide maturase [Peptococcaceae bacterium]MDH7523774.1 thioether cross-link-forming SCIFF peptide maturase [Peptococcaceae bacterium]
MPYDFSLVHTFAINDTYMVLDINSGIIHSLSPAAWDFLTAWERAGGNAGKAIDQLSYKHGRAELETIYSLFEQLREEGMLFSRDEQLESYSLPGEGIVKALCLHVAHDCNMRCRYCFAGTGSFGGERRFMDLETGKRALDFLFEVSGPRKHVEIDYFGGEPLLNYPVVRELVRYGKKKAAEQGKELKQSLTTNALLLDREKIDFFNREGIHMILSIDGRPQVHNRMRPLPGKTDSYGAVIKAIKAYVDSQKEEAYFIRGTYTRYNLDFCADFLHLVNKGFRRISLEPVVASPGADYALREEDVPFLFDQYRELAEICLDLYRDGHNVNFFHFNIDLDKGPCLPKRLTGCGAGHEYLAVSPAGDLYPCHQFMGQENFIVGSVYAGITNKTLCSEFRSAHVLNKQPCRECWARFFCSGGCHANAYNYNGSIFEPYRIACEIQKKRLECAIYLQVKKWELEQKGTGD